MQLALPLQPAPGVNNMKYNSLPLEADYDITKLNFPDLLARVMATSLTGGLIRPIRACYQHVSIDALKISQPLIRNGCS